MGTEEAKRVIVIECLKPGGFAQLIRENQVDEQGYLRLMEAIAAVSRESASNDKTDRLVVACLFELPWEIENTIEHYSRQSKELGATVSKMAEGLREAINAWLWNGLESHYES